MVRCKQTEPTMCVMAGCVARARLVPSACLVPFAPALARGAMPAPHEYPVLGVV